MKEQDEDEGARRRLISKANMKEQDEDEDNVLELHPLGAFLYGGEGSAISCSSSAVRGSHDYFV